MTGPLPDGRGSDQNRDTDQNRDREGAACSRIRHPDSAPLAYLLTFPTYGTWLHGDERGSVDREHDLPGTPMLPADPGRERRERQHLRHPPVTLDAERRAVVQHTIVEVCEHRNWTIHALNVRGNHVHVVVSAPQSPERAMNALKSWTTRRLVEAGLLPRGTKAWVRHGSTRYLWKRHQVEAACRYVLDGQGPDI